MHLPGSVSYALEFSSDMRKALRDQRDETVQVTASFREHNMEGDSAATNDPNEWSA
jgi:hypothetical protein